MDIKLFGTLVPVDKKEPDFPTHLAQFGKGGHRTVKNMDKLNFIPESLKEDGMTVFVESEQKTFLLYKESWKEVTTSIDETDEFLSADNGLKANIKLNFDTTSNTIQLRGKNNKLLGDPIRLDFASYSAIVFASALSKNKFGWVFPENLIIPDHIKQEIVKQGYNMPQKEDYLVLVYEISEHDGLRYDCAFIDISKYIDLYNAGDGLGLEESIFKVIIDPNSDKNISVSKTGIKTKTRVMSIAEFDDITFADSDNETIFVY